MSLKKCLKEAPTVSDIVAMGGRVEMAYNKSKTYYVEVKVGEKSKGSYRNKEWLRKSYEEQDLTMQEIADQFGVTPMTINLWLKKHGIETRPRGRRS